MKLTSHGRQGPPDGQSGPPEGRIPQALPGSGKGH